MSTLSKILVVLLVLLAIAHSAVLLAYLSQQRSWKELAQANQGQLNDLRALRVAEIQDNKLTVDRLETERDNFKDNLADKTSLLDQKLTELTDLNLRMGRLTTDNQAFQQQLANLNASLARAQLARDHATSQLGTTRDTASKLKAENAQLERKVAELLRDVRVLDTEVRDKKQQIVALQDEVRKAKGRLTAGISTAPLAAAPGAFAARRAIKGTVTDVNVNAKIATINVGSIAGVSIGTKFTIQNENYVGQLLITRVLRDESLGTIILSARPVSVGDQVTTDPLQ